jgi:hypothetical protein
VSLSELVVSSAGRVVLGSFIEFANTMCTSSICNTQSLESRGILIITPLYFFNFVIYLEEVICLPLFDNFTEVFSSIFSPYSWTIRRVSVRRSSLIKVP